MGRAADKVEARVEAADDPRVDRGRSVVEDIDDTPDEPLRREDTIILPKPDDPLRVVREDKEPPPPGNNEARAAAELAPDDSCLRKRPLVFDAEPPAML